MSVEKFDTPGPLNRAQWDFFYRRSGRLAGWLGNRIGDLRYWLWMVSR